MTLEQLPTAFTELRNELHRIRAVLLNRQFDQEWYTLRQACELKGVSVEVVRKRPRRYWPNQGHGHPVINNGGHYSEMYHRTEVEAWLPLTETDIDAQIAREEMEND